MNCIFRTKNKKVVVAENNRSAFFENPTEIDLDRGQVDGCLITGDKERCDAFVRNDDKIWLIELKGRNVEKAVSQIVATSNHIEDEIGGREIIPVIVATRCPAVSGQQKALKGLLKIRGNFANRFVLKTRRAVVCVE